MQLAAQGCLIANHMGGLYGSVDYHQSHTSLSLSLSLSLSRSLARSLAVFSSGLSYVTLNIDAAVR